MAFRRESDVKKEDWIYIRWSNVWKDMSCVLYNVQCTYVHCTVNKFNLFQHIKHINVNSFNGETCIPRDQGLNVNAWFAIIKILHFLILFCWIYIQKNKKQTVYSTERDIDKHLVNFTNIFWESLWTVLGQGQTYGGKLFSVLENFLGSSTGKL